MSLQLNISILIVFLTYSRNAYAFVSKDAIEVAFFVTLLWFAPILQALLLGMKSKNYLYIVNIAVLFFLPWTLLLIPYSQNLEVMISCIYFGSPFVALFINFIIYKKYK